MGRYFLDTEFIEDGETIDLISIGMVDERNMGLHLLNIECDFRRANSWVRENVLPHLPRRPMALPSIAADNNFQTVERRGRRVLEGWGTRHAIRKHIEAFVGGVPSPQFWAYFADYDWVVFCQLFGRMIDLPERFPKYCRDLKQLMWHLGVHKEDFLIERATEHDAYEDALWNQQAYQHLLTIVEQRNLTRKLNL